jgi:hypothetical protein
MTTDAARATSEMSIAMQKPCFFNQYSVEPIEGETVAPITHFKGETIDRAVAFATLSALPRLCVFPQAMANAVP